MLVRIVAVCLLLAGCSNEPKAARVWTPEDRAHPPETMVDPNRVPQQERPDLTVGELLWQRNCARCHGTNGRGGGQAGAANLTSPEWQASKSNAAIARSIAAGVAPAMPAFAELLSPEQIGELVKHIRTLRSE